jgi:hypothetical protein
MILLLLAAVCRSQIYYCASVGIGTGKYYNGKTKQHGTGINDLYLSVPVGYTAHDFLIELQPQITASNNESVSLMAGYRISAANAGIHLLGGYTDQLAFRMKPFTVSHSFYITGTVRVWFGNAMVQGTYFNGQYYLGVGIIGF